MNFAIGLATANGAQTGLVPAAKSASLPHILGAAFQRGRAESTCVILLGIRYDWQRARGASHQAAVRQLSNWLSGTSASGYGLWVFIAFPFR